MDRKHHGKITKKIKLQNHKLVPNPNLSSDFIEEDILLVLKEIKLNKAAGFDGVFPEMLKNCGPLARSWLCCFFNNILDTGNLPTEFKRAKVLSVLKPGKDGSDVAHFRPISLLSVTYKLFERLILSRIEPVIDKALPISQVGFRKNRSCAEQLAALYCFWICTPF